MNSCEVVKDLIPLYIEDLTTEESSKMIKEHISKCSKCKKYYEDIKKDYESNISNTISPNKENLDKAMKKVMKYQENIKLLSISIAMLVTAIIIGARVQFLDTIPILVLVPFVCKLFYNKEIPIILLSIPSGIIAGVISGETPNILLFGVIMFIVTTIFVYMAKIIETSIKEDRKIRKRIGVFFVCTSLVIGILVNNYFFGNPIGYISNLIKIKSYVAENYNLDAIYNEKTLKYKSLNYNHYIKAYEAKYECRLGRFDNKQIIGIKIIEDEIIDDYKDIIEVKFCAERANDMRVDLGNKGLSKIFVMAYREEYLNINQYCLNDFYYMMGSGYENYEISKEARKNECSKLIYKITIGESSMDVEKMTKDEFINKSLEIYKVLKENGQLYKKIEINAENDEGKVHRVNFNMNSNEDNIKNSYILGEC